MRVKPKKTHWEPGSTHEAWVDDPEKWEIGKLKKKVHKPKRVFLNSIDGELAVMMARSDFSIGNQNPSYWKQLDRSKLREALANGELFI